jgi:DNA-binding transcriptional LysR family regulator
MKAYPLDLLASFLVFVESPSISVASQRLGLTQPAVSLQLKRLDEQLPHPLFVFRGKKKVLSHYGKAVYETIRHRLPEIGHSIDRLNLVYSKPEEMELRIGVRREILVLISERIHFDGKLQFIHLSNQEILAGLKDQRIDVGLTWEKPDDTNIVARPLLRQGAKLIVPKAWSKEAKDLSSVEYLKGKPCLAYKEGQSPYLTEWCRAQKIEVGELKVRRVIDDWLAIAGMAAQGIGWSIVPSGIALQPQVLGFPLPTTVIADRLFYQLYSKSLKHLDFIKTLFHSEQGDL